MSIPKHIFQKDCRVKGLIPSQTWCGKFLFTCYDLKLCPWLIVIPTKLTTLRQYEETTYTVYIEETGPLKEIASDNNYSSH